MKLPIPKNKHKDSATLSFCILISIMLATIINAKNQNALYPLDLTQRNKLHQYTKRASLSETDVSSSTVRPWPSDEFLRNVLAQSKKRNKVGQPKHSWSHKQSLKTPNVHLGMKLNNINNTKMSENNSSLILTQIKGEETTFLKFSSPSTVTEISSKPSNLLKNENKSKSHLNSKVRQASILNNSKLIEKDEKTIERNDKTFSRQIPEFTTSVQNILNGSEYSKESKTSSQLNSKNNDQDFKHKIRKEQPMNSNTKYKLEPKLKLSNRKILNSRNIPTLNKDVKIASRSPINSYSSEIPKRTSSEELITNKASHIYKIPYRKTTPGNASNINHRKLDNVDHDNTIDHLHQWIEKDNIVSVSPSSKLPNFTNLKWPYKHQMTDIKPIVKNKLTIHEKMRTSTTQRSDPIENFGVGFQYEMSPSLTATTMASSTRNHMDMDHVPDLWQRVPTVTAYPIAQLPFPVISNKVAYGSNYISSSGIIGKKPSKQRPQTSPSVNANGYIQKLTTANNKSKSFHPTDLISHVTQQIVEDPLIKSQPQTNIWYKPVINHFTSNGDNLASDSSILEFPLVFKIWKYKNGHLTLKNEREIPAWALEGFKVMDGSILNLDEIPLSLQKPISSAILKNNENNENNPKISGYKPTAVGVSESYSTRWSKPKNKNKTYINYVILIPNKPSAYSSTAGPDLKFSVTSTQSIPTEIETLMQAHNPPVNYLDQYLHVLTTPKPKRIISEKVSSSETWNKLQRLIYMAQLRLSTPVQQSSLSASDVQQDSFLSKTSDDRELLANLAAIAILISYMKNQLPPKLQNTSGSLDSKYSSTSPNSFNSAMHKLFEELLNNNIPAESSQRVKVGDLLPLSHQSHNKSHFLSSDSHLAQHQPHSSDSMTKTLLITGAIKKGKKKSKKKKFKKKFHALIDKISHPLAHLMKKPKQYWFDVKFDVDIFDIMKKKFLYLLAFKYAPVALVVALLLVPLGIVIIPLLWKIYWIKKKIYWVKKKPKYIRVPVPVPVPKPYPVYPYQQHQHNYYDHYNNRPLEPHYAADSSNINDLNHEDRNLMQPSQNSQIDSYSVENSNYPSNDDSNKLKPQAVTHAYEFGFDLGSKMSSLTNEHDKQVLSILLENKKDTIKKLLEKWNLIHQKSKSVSPMYKDSTYSEHRRRGQASINRKNGKLNLQIAIPAV